MRRKYTDTFRVKFAQMCACVVCVLCICCACFYVLCMCLLVVCVLILFSCFQLGERAGGGEEVVGSSSCGYFQFGQLKGRLHKRTHYDPFNDRFTSSLSAQLDFYAHIFQLVPLQIIQLLCYELVHKIKSTNLL